MKWSAPAKVIAGPLCAFAMHGLEDLNTIQNVLSPICAVKVTGCCVNRARFAIHRMSITYPSEPIHGVTQTVPAHNTGSSPSVE